MSKYLISTVETYRVDSENEVNQLIEEAKQNGNFELTKHTVQKKQKMVKGVVEDEWFRVTFNKVFDNEKEPVGNPITSEQGDE